ncbi:MAG: MFS transporter [Lachnospiraceae bacterium]|jgi:MFS family permease|nr:MFS transporter [Lachnospiraceae bacterium]
MSNKEMAIGAATTETTTTDRIWNPLFTKLFIANACMYLSQQMMNSLVSKYADFLGAAATIVGLVSSIYALTALIFKIVAGPVIDTYNKRIILTITMGIMALAFLGYGISGNIPMLLSSRLVQGIGQAFTSTCCLALAADTLPKAKFGSGIGIYSMAQAASQAVGPALALFLLDILGYQMTFFVGCAIMIFAAVLAFRVVVPYTRTKKLTLNFKSIIAKNAVMPASMIFLLSLTYFVINSFLIVYAGKLKIEHIGYYFTVYAGCMLITRPLVGKLTDKFGLIKVMVPALFCFALSFVIISYSKTLWGFLLAALISSFGYGVCVPSLQTLTMKSVTAAERGAGSSTNFVGTDLGSLVGPIIAGWVAEQVGYQYMWRIMTIPVGLTLAVLIINHRRVRRIEADFETRQD